MCSNERTTSGSVSGGSLIPYPLAALKQLNDAPVPTSTSPSPAGVPTSLLPLDHYRLQLYNYAMAERLRFTHQLSHYPSPMPICPTYPAYNPRLAFSMSLFHHRALQPEEPKPQHSYIGLIAMAILSSADLKLVLSDIYQHILDNYPYFRARGPGWRNSIRHNLSLNDCFIKAGRSANGKGHYWAIHAANIDDFRKGDFRRRKAQRKVRKHMGLSVDEEGNDSPSPPPVPVSPPMMPASMMPICWGSPSATQTPIFPTLSYGIAKKRQFDVASLLAPDEDDVARKRRLRAISSGDEDNGDEDIDVVNSEDKESVDAEEGVVTARQILPGVLPGWPHQTSPMFPGTPASLVASMEQQLVSRYYEQLAAAQQQQQQQQRRFLLQQQGLCSVSLANGVNNNNPSPDKTET